MLPVGGTVLVVSTLALVAVGLFALTVPFAGEAWPWRLAWAAAAALLAWRNIRAGIAIISAFDWRPLPAVLLTSALIVAAWLRLP